MQKQIWMMPALPALGFIGGFYMAAVFGAFIQYVGTMIYYIVIAGLGIAAGKALLKRKKEKDAQDASEK